jgi:gliding motility-associated lipoprotein GldD
MKMLYFFKYFTFCLVIILLSCGEETYTPKPRSFPRVDYPEKVYQKFDTSFCKFTFAYPQYARFQRDSFNFFDNKTPSDCWFSFHVPSLNAAIYFSYYNIGGANSFAKLRDDAYKLAGKHNIRADYIDELPISKPKSNVGGVVFDIQGPAGCPFQFFVTDSSHHFLRGALYFNTKARPDSLAPILNFIKTDLMEIINTFEWKK